MGSRADKGWIFNLSQSASYFSMQLISAADSAVPKIDSEVQSMRIFIMRACAATNDEVVSAGIAATIGSTSIANRYSWL